ncbi:hypothetical protein BDV23DRAFT_178042 [Aspergillus alliaceus]|uniref:Uncharacterized protein n=1 Tax=Petromyces alliaceus TaxID=209559 RepID=A0A5N7CPE7_PETAA|nr:hypothetical protein BDV23DRAFT_178042 [Aspergillus alliaceus]
MGGPEYYPCFYYAQEYYHELRLRKRHLAHREALLDFYWSSQEKSDSHQFLKESGLITQYSHLKTTQFLDAIDSCGEGILALLLADGWHKKNLLILAGLAVLISISVTALTTAVARDLDAGLTVGSYTSGVAALLIATLTFFSAIL